MLRKEIIYCNYKKLIIKLIFLKLTKSKLIFFSSKPIQLRRDRIRLLIPYIILFVIEKNISHRERDEVASVNLFTYFISYERNIVGRNVIYNRDLKWWSELSTLSFGVIYVIDERDNAGFSFVLLLSVASHYQCASQKRSLDNKIAIH